MKFVVTIPALPHKHFEVDTKDSLTAFVDALRGTVWTVEDFKTRLLDKGFVSQQVDFLGNPMDFAYKGSPDNIGSEDAGCSGRESFR
jgi:hypothetical protein